jgi:carbonic anhydrase/acetyltransferase-like protein (isoleucine patch superfamily)
VTGAIIIVGSESWKREGTSPKLANTPDSLVQSGSLACTELLGRSLLARTVDNLKHCGFDSVSVIRSTSLNAPFGESEKEGFFSAAGAWSKAEESISTLKERGADSVLVLGLGAYMEQDPAQILQFHFDEGAALTRAMDEQGELDFWVVDPNRVPSDRRLWDFLYNERPAYFPVQTYVNRLESGRDLRKLVCDGLTFRCQFRPQAFEVRPGVWIATDAEVEKEARIVAPAFIGRGAKIANQCLITRGTNIESNSHVDYGSAVEDSSVLANTYVGIGLDLSHSIVDRNFLLNLHHEVSLEISDPAVLRQKRESRARGKVDGQAVADLNRGELAMSSAEDWQ